MRRQVRPDEGAAMVMVLIVVVLVALVSTVFLNKSATESRAGAALQTQARLTYGADAGLEQAVRVMSDDLASATRKNCLTPFTPTMTISTFTWTGAHFPVTVSCQDLQGYAADNASAGLYGAAIITTGGADSLTTQSAVNNPLDVGGTIYISGSETSNDLKKIVHLTRGDLAVLGCSGSPNIAEISVSAPYGQYCTTLTPDLVAPSISLPAVPTTAPVPVTLPGNHCRIFVPGKYTADPSSSLLSGNHTSNYFASGNYYFDGNFTISVPNNTEIVAGAPSPGDVDAKNGNTAITGCSDDATAQGLAGAAAGAINGTGAAFFMGKTAAISIAQGTLSMYSRPVTAGLDVPLNLYAVRAGDTGWDAWTGGNTPVVGITNPNANMLFNGQINAYDAPVRVFASNPTYAAVRAGIIGKTVDLQASASGTNLDVSGYGTSSTTGFRLVKLTATAAGVGGDGGSFTGVAIVKFPNDTSIKPSVLSWRFS
jgi:hypothetical protein